MSWDIYEKSHITYRTDVPPLIHQRKLVQCKKNKKKTFITLCKFVITVCLESIWWSSFSQYDSTAGNILTRCWCYTKGSGVHWPLAIILWKPWIFTVNFMAIWQVAVEILLDQSGGLKKRQTDWGGQIKSSSTLLRWPACLNFWNASKSDRKLFLL